MNSKQNIYLKELAELRFAVINCIFNLGWFKHNVLDSTSEEVISYVLPKTKQKAILNLAIQTICLENDKNIIGNKIHLFRLPHNIEMALSNFPIKINNEDCTHVLEELADGVAVETKSGPINIGSVAEINEKYIIQVFAKHYLNAIKGGYKTFPYLQ